MKTLNYIVQSFKLGKGVVSTQHDQRYLQWGLDGLRKLKDFQLMPEVLKVERLEIKHDGVIPYANLPQDYQEMIRIGIRVCGILINFDKNDALTFAVDNPCPCDPLDIASQIDCCINNTNNNATSPTQTWMYGNPVPYANNGVAYTANVYGIGAGFYHGGYKIDYAKRRIVFDRCIKLEECILEYLADVNVESGNCYVPDKMVEAIRTWIDYEAKYNSINPTESRRSAEAKQRWFQCVRDINSQQQAMNKEQWVSLIRMYCYEEVIW